MGLLDIKRTSIQSGWLLRETLNNIEQPDAEKMYWIKLVDIILFERRLQSVVEYVMDQHILKKWRPSPLPWLFVP